MVVTSLGCFRPGFHDFSSPAAEKGDSASESYHDLSKRGSASFPEKHKIFWLTAARHFLHVLYLSGLHVVLIPARAPKTCGQVRACGRAKHRLGSPENNEGTFQRKKVMSQPLHARLLQNKRL
jgi:hypothetical protein